MRRPAGARQWPEQHEFRQRLLDVLLDNPLHRACAHQHVVAFLHQPLTCLVIDIKQGSGDDVVNAFGNGAVVGDNGKLALKLDSGSGNDIASIVFPQAVVNNELLIEVQQGEGDDTAFFFAEEALLGPGSLLEVKWDGGSGLDQGHTSVGASAESTGRLKAEVKGGDDDDSLTLAVVAPAGVDLDALLDGGNGFDTCLATPNVEVKNCEA